MHRSQQLEHSDAARDIFLFKTLDQFLTDSLRRAFRSNPNSLIIVTGCYPQLEPDAFLKMKGVHYLLGNGEKREIPDLLPLMQKAEFPRVQVGDIQKEILFSEIPLHSFHRHTRAFLKIQDGCNAYCSYCIVPHARGRSRSLQPERVIENLKGLKEKGFKEVVLPGIHLGAYGLDLNPSLSLERLLRQLEKEETPDRIRLSSMEPADFPPGLISALSQSSKICPHLHLSIQSGDDEMPHRTPSQARGHVEWRTSGWGHSGDVYVSML